MSRSSFSGTGYDRWSYEQSSHHAGANDNALNKLQHKFWVTRTKVVRKFGKEEDEHIVASDAELDAKLELFLSINETTCKLEQLLEFYQERVCHLAFEENAMGRFLKDHGKLDRTRAGKMMVAVGKTMSHSGQQRLAIRTPLVRLHQEVETFKARAIEDTGITVKKMEKGRTDYRGTLMWMKNVSTELDPDTYKQLEKFRKVQAHVKSGKMKFDKLKIDVLQKVDLLAAARCNMFSYALIQYQDSLIAFWKKTAKTMGHVDTSFQGYQPYEFTYIRDLAEPSRQLAQSLKSPSKKSKKKNKDNADKVDDKDQAEEDQMNKDDLLFFGEEYKDEPPEKAEDALKCIELSEETKQKAEESLQNLLELGGDDDDELLLDIDTQLTEKQLEKLPMLSGQPDTDLFTPIIDKNDAQLLSDLMSDNPMQDEDNQSGFSAQWNAMFGNSNVNDKKSLTEGDGKLSKPSGLESDLLSPSSEFGDFMSARIGQEKTSGTPAGDADLFGILKNKDSAKSNKKNKNKAFLPSQLFDLDQSLFSQQSPRSGPHDLLSDFPMPSPVRPSSVQLQIDKMKKDGDEAASLFLDDDILKNQSSEPIDKKLSSIERTTSNESQSPSSSTTQSNKKDMSQWFSLFADLDPLANPDAIGKSTKDSDPSCYS